MGRPSVYLPRHRRVNGWLTEFASGLFDEAALALRVRERLKEVSEGNTIEYVLREWKLLKERARK